MRKPGKTKYTGVRSMAGPGPESALAGPSAAPIPAAGQGKRGESGHLGYLLRQAAGSFRLRLERALADLNVTQPQFGIMTMIAAYPGASNADLARLNLLTPQTVSTIIANLLRAEIVRRQPHAVHGRIQQLELTESGAALLAICKERVAQMERDLTGTLSAKDEEIVRRWLVATALPESPSPVITDV